MPRADAANSEAPDQSISAPMLQHVSLLLTRSVVQSLPHSCKKLTSSAGSVVMTSRTVGAVPKLHSGCGKERPEGHSRHREGDCSHQLCQLCEALITRKHVDYQSCLCPGFRMILESFVSMLHIGLGPKFNLVSMLSQLPLINLRWYCESLKLRSKLLPNTRQFCQYSYFRSVWHGESHNLKP